MLNALASALRRPSLDAVLDCLFQPARQPPSAAPTQAAIRAKPGWTSFFAPDNVIVNGIQAAALAAALAKTQRASAYLIAGGKAPAALGAHGESAGRFGLQKLVVAIGFALRIDGHPLALGNWRKVCR